MAGRLFRGVFQLANKVENAHLGKRMADTARTFFTGPVPKADKFVKKGYIFGRPPFGEHYGHPPVPIGADGLPSFVNWTTIPGAVWDAQDQGETGLCYMFAALGSVGSVNFLATGKSIDLSKQQIVDCNTLTGDVNLGGHPCLVLDYIQAGGILPTSLYPYAGLVKDVCKRIKGPGVTIDGWERVKPNSEADLKYAVAHQPVVVNLCVSKPMFYENWELAEFSTYSGGMVYGPSYSFAQLDHSMLLVGYGETELGQLFWLLLNSYSTSWGKDGLFFLARGTGQRGGALGILRDPAIPLKWSPNRIVISKCDSCSKCFY